MLFILITYQLEYEPVKNVKTQKLETMNHWEEEENNGLPIINKTSLFQFKDYCKLDEECKYSREIKLNSNDPNSIKESLIFRKKASDKGHIESMYNLNVIFLMQKTINSKFYQFHTWIINMISLFFCQKIIQLQDMMN